MTDYTAFDAAILHELSAGPVSFMLLCQRLRWQANVLAKPNHRGELNGSGVVDRRLQALRKAGKIKVSRIYGWSLT